MFLKRLFNQSDEEDEDHGQEIQDFQYFNK